MISKKQILPIMFAALLLLGCNTNMKELDKGSDTLTLSVSTTTLVLNQRFANREAIQFSWSSGTNYNTGGAIFYTFQVDKKGNNFAQALTYDIGKTDSRFLSFTHQQLNDTLLAHWQIPTEEKAEFEARVMAHVAKSDREVQVSETMAFWVTPYKFRILDLYMIGDATPNGWDNQRATAMTEMVDQSGGFVWEGILKKGELKFIVAQGQFYPSYVRDASDEHKIAYCETEGAIPDLKFNIAQTGTYKVTLNIDSLTISIVNLDGDVPYSTLYLFGSAVDGNPILMKQSETDPFQFSYSGNLKAGRFQIATNATATNCDLYQPQEDAPSLTNSSVELVLVGNIANKAWQLPADNKYTVALDLRNRLLTVSPFVAYANIWMIGDATSGGWSWSNITAMTQTATNPNEFIYEGALQVGELKFPLERKEDWSGLFILAKTNHQPLTETGYIIANQPDNKWQITTAGNYKIVINVYDETIHFTQK